MSERSDSRHAFAAFCGRAELFGGQRIPQRRAVRSGKASVSNSSCFGQLRPARNDDAGDVAARTREALLHSPLPIGSYLLARMTIGTRPRRGCGLQRQLGAEREQHVGLAATSSLAPAKALATPSSIRRNSTTTFWPLVKPSLCNSARSGVCVLQPDCR